MLCTVISVCLYQPKIASLFYFYSLHFSLSEAFFFFLILKYTFRRSDACFLVVNSQFLSKKKKVLFFWTVEWCFTWEYNSWLTWFLSAKYYYFIVSLRGLIVVPLYIIRLPFLDLKVSLSLVLFSFFMCLNADFFFMYLPWDLCLLNLMSSIHSGKISASIFWNIASLFFPFF